MSECVQTALITGAGNGIGRAIALAMADSAEISVCADISLDDAQRTVQSNRTTGWYGSRFKGRCRLNCSD